MAGLIRLTSVWSGFAGAPGYTNFYCGSTGVNEQAVANSFAGSVRAFWLSINGYLPAAVAIDISRTWQGLNDESGDILTEGTLTESYDTVQGTSGALYAGNAGFAVNWGTDVFIAGRRLKGRTYFVPSAGAFATDGSLSDAAMDAIVAAALDFATTSDQVPKVWHRPVNGAGGSSSAIITATVTDRAAILRTRSV